MIIHSSFHGGDGGGEVGVGMAAAVIIFSMPLFGDFFPTLYKRLKHNKGEDFIWAALAPCPILLVRETILFIGPESDHCLPLSLTD